MDLLSIPTPLVPSLDEVILVGINERFVLAMDTCARRRLCHLQVGIHALATHPHLTSDVGYIDPFREEIMSLVIPFHPHLMQLDALLARIEKISNARDRFLALATELERGSIVHRRAVRANLLNQLRDQAVNDLRLQADAKDEPLVLPGPEASRWIEWACALKEPEDSEVLQSLRRGFASLDNFIANLEPGMWLVKAESVVEELT